MFSKATANFVSQLDPEGSLIHVTRINDSQKLVLMALVVKRNRVWAWQRPKYQPTDFTLSDLLQGDKVLSPGVSEAEFLTYKGTFGDNLYGKLDTEAGPVSVALEVQGFSKLHAGFGKLRKEELDVKKLLHDSGSRYMDMQHVLVQQLKKPAEVLAVVKERILTTNSCSITQIRKEQCAFQGVLGLLGMLGSSVKVCVKDVDNIEVDSDVSLDIPSDTVIAYSVLELEIKKNGRYNICLQPGTAGGIEDDSTALSWSSDDVFLDTVDGVCHESQEMDLSPLADLPQSTQRALFKGLQETLRDRNALTYLQCMLEALCCGETPDMSAHEELSETQRILVSDVLDQLGVDSSAGSGRSCLPSHRNAAHLLVSALEELPDETLSLLSESCPRFLEDLNTLMGELKDSSEPLPIQLPPALLQGNQDFQLAEQLLSTSNVTLRRDTNRLWMEPEGKAGVHLLVLRLSVHGLYLLCKELK